MKQDNISRHVYAIGLTLASELFALPAQANNWQWELDQIKINKQRQERKCEAEREKIRVKKEGTAVDARKPAESVRPNALDAGKGK